VVERYYHGPPQYDCCEGPATRTACKSEDGRLPATSNAASRSAESFTIGTAVSGMSSDDDTDEAEQVMLASIHADLLVLRL
jgi:hypothetical protein